MKRFRLVFVALIGLSLSAHSQSIKGKLVDLIDSKPLAGATLTLTSLKDTLQSRYAVADSVGVFRFDNVAKDSFFLKVNFIGYAEYREIISVSDSIPSVDMGTLFIPKSTKEMAGVVVVSRTPPAQQKGDTLQLNASQFKVNPDATTEDLIKKMPGITVDRDGTVTAQGEQVRKVTIDGREFFGDDATAALRNLPSEIVDKIQVFDRLSDQAQFTGFDDGNSQKAINIVTKSGIRNGQFGRIYAGYGTDERYSAGGNVSFFKDNRRISVVGNFNNINQQNFAAQDLLGVTSNNNRGGGGGRGGPGGGGRGGPGGGGRGWGGGTDNFTVGQQSGISKTNAVGLNFSDKWGQKVDVQASYFFNQSNNVNDRILRSQIISPDGTTQFTDQNTISRTTNYNHRFNMRLEYKIDSNNSLIVSPSLNFQKNESSSLSNSQNYFTGGDTANTSLNNNINDRKGFNIRNNILYRHSFAKRGRTLSVNLNTTFNDNDGEGYTKSFFRFPKSGSPDSLLDQYRVNPTSGYNLSANIAYTEPIGKHSQLQFNYAPSYQKNKADQQTFDHDDLSKLYDDFRPDLSNRFDNTITTQNGGISYRLQPDRDNQFSVGVNYQHSRLESERLFPTEGRVDQTFSVILPNLMWRTKLSAKSSIRVFYRANTNFPSVTQLQDVVDNSNPLRVSMGNPTLKQSYTHFVSGRYTFTNTQKGQSFFANIFLQTAADYITNAIYIANADSIIHPGTVLIEGSQLTKPVNVDGYKSLRTFFTYSMPVAFIKSTVNLNAGFSYSTLPGMVNYEKTMADNFIYSAGAVIASNISEYVDFNLSYNATINNTKNSSPNQPDNKYVNQAVGAQVNLLSKNGWFVQNDVNYQYNSGLSEGLNPNFWLWNAGIGKKFLKNRSGELKLSVFDLLGQNQSVTRTVTGTEIIDEQNTVLRRYFMLTFTYSLKNFGTGAKPAGDRRPMMNF